MKSRACTAKTSARPCRTHRVSDRVEASKARLPPHEIHRRTVANRTPVPRRVVRLVRLALHLVLGLAIAWLRFPRLSEAERHARKRRWSRQLLAIVSVSVRETGAPKKLPDRCMLALNHISWLDIFVINAELPASFMAKSEIRSWPLVGWLCTRAGTLYIERGKRSAVREARRAVSIELERGALIAVCPEGTTTFGRTLERFHSALFQPAIDAGAVLQPVALRYFDPAGRHTDAAGYVGETSLLESVWAIVSTRHMVAELHFLKPIDAAGQTRRALAEKTETAIAAALGVPLPGRHSPRREPDRDEDRRAGPQ
jgi:1-acyl-sn-glycerol-3-phosphate acyltransferase